MNRTRFYNVATLLPNGNVLVVGGEGDGTDNAEVFDPTAGTFQLTSRMANARLTGHTITLLRNGSVLITGGAATYGRPWTILRAAEVY